MKTLKIIFYTILLSFAFVLGGRFIIGSNAEANQQITATNTATIRDYNGDGNPDFIERVDDLVLEIDERFYITHQSRRSFIKFSISNLLSLKNLSAKMYLTQHGWPNDPVRWYLKEDISGSINISAWNENNVIDTGIIEKSETGIDVIDISNALNILIDRGATNFTIGLVMVNNNTSHALYTGIPFPYFIIETANAPPISDAGLDKLITIVGSIVQLDGSQSYDLEGDPISFKWSIISKPDSSIATLSDPTASNPTFVADIHGNYIIELIVSDAYSSSEPDQIEVSFDNVRPVAIATPNQSVLIGETACFESESMDENGDPLLHTWTLITSPAGSSAFIDGPHSLTPCIKTDIAGIYEVSLIVNDGFLESEPSIVSVLAISSQDITATTLEEAITVVNNFDVNLFKNVNMQKIMANKVNVTLQMIDQGAYTEALNKLKDDLLEKTDGCKTTGEPDRNDWIQDCASQNQIYPLIIKAIGYLETVLN